MSGNRPGVKAFLRERLPRDMYDLLREATHDFTLPAFRRDPGTGDYECILDSPVLGEDERFIDAACTACELLAASGGDFRGDPAIARGGADGGERGEISLEYWFDLNDRAAFDHFRRLAVTPDQRAAGIRAEVEERSDGYLVRVRMLYESDFDYQRKKDSLEWMLDLARKMAKDTPYSGRKL